MTARTWPRIAIAIVCAAGLDVSPATAQQRPPPTSAGQQPQTTVRGFADFGAVRFAAADTFDAVLGSSLGVLFGGGVEVVLPQRVFVSARVSRFTKNGERVFVADDEVFPLGIDTEVAITPVEISGGYRFAPRGRRRSAIPYLGGGIGWHRYSETSEFAADGENVSETFTGFHLLGGLEFRLNRLFGLSGEAQWASVPDSLGEDLTSAAAAFGESNLGGLGFRVKLVIGR